MKSVQRCVSLVLLVVACVYCQDHMENLSFASRRIVTAPDPECPPGYTYSKGKGKCVVLARRMQSFDYDDDNSGLERILPHFPTRKCPPGSRRTSTGKCREGMRRRMQSFDYYNDASGYLTNVPPRYCPPGYVNIKGKCAKLGKSTQVLYDYFKDASGYLTDVPRRPCPPGYAYDANSGRCRELAIESSYNY